MDLHALVEHLDLGGMVLAGFSMGTGEVTRYLATYGSSRVAKAVQMDAIPFLDTCYNVDVLRPPGSATRPGRTASTSPWRLPPTPVTAGGVA